MTTTTDILTAIEVDDSIEDATGGLYGVAHVTGIVVREVSRSESRDGFPYWAVMVELPGEPCVIKTFTHKGRVAAQNYAWDVALALDLEVS